MSQNKTKFNENKRFENYEDSLWRVIMFNYAKHEGKELFKENETLKIDPQLQPSNAERKKFHNLLDNELRKHKLRSLIQMSKKIFTKIAVVVFVLILGFALLFTTVEAFRVQVLNLILTFEKEYTSIKLGEGNGNITAGFRNTYAPTYIPAGYWIYDISDMGETKLITYKNDAGESIDFYDYAPSLTTNLDTENAEIIKSITINGKSGMFVLKNELSTISWSNDEKIFIISAYISESEIIKIAESVIYIK